MDEVTSPLNTFLTFTDLNILGLHWRNIWGLEEKRAFLCLDTAGLHVYNQISPSLHLIRHLARGQGRKRAMKWPHP